MELVIVRHGETIENATGTVQGHLPGHLSEQGKKQSLVLARKLSKEQFDQIWSSDLKRCIDTAKYITKFHPESKLQTTSALREINFGELQGKTSDEVDWDSIEGTRITRKFPGGESNLEMMGRVFGFINDLAKKFPEQKVLIITHGGPMRVIKSSIEKIPVDEVFNRDIGNAQVLRYDIKQPLKIYLAHPG